MNEDIIQDLGYLATQLVYDIRQTIEKTVLEETSILWLILAMTEKEERIELFTLDSQCQNLKIFLDNLRCPPKFNCENEIFARVLGMVFEEVNVPKMYYEYFYSKFVINVNDYHKSPVYLMSEYIFVSDVSFEKSNVVFSIIRKKNH